MPRPAVFLDRDGTVVHDPGYLSDPAQVRLIPGAADAIRRLADGGFACVVITNQSGIGRGKYDETAFEAVQAEVDRQLAADGVVLDGCFHCPHTPEAGCVCRKPGTALHREAAARLDVDLARSWCVGDRLGDVTAATALGANAVLVRTGEGEQHADVASAAGIPVVDDLAAAAELILATS